MICTVTKLGARIKIEMDYMGQALSLARLALGQVSPNPAVGAVVVGGDKVVGQGYTQPPGSWHAEIAALKQAGTRASGGVMYVTLEPCCCYGRTPPCTQVIIEAGISEVHLAMIDPNPLVSGKGKNELEKNGINVYVGECEEIASEINEAYTKYITTGMPFVTAKFAMSLDGKIATSSGDSKWISNEASRKYLHILRHMTDAIMVGAKTILIDDPHLTARSGSGRGGTSRKQPLRVIVDGRCLISPGARIFSEPGKTLLTIGKIASSEETKAFTEASADLLELPSSGEQIDLERLLRILGEKQITSVLVEGGGMLLGDLFDRGLVDKVIAFVAPIVIGGVGARTPVGGKGVDKVVDSIKLERVKAERFNDDSMISGYVKK